MQHAYNRGLCNYHPTSFPGNHEFKQDFKAMDVNQNYVEIPCILHLTTTDSKNDGSIADQKSSSQADITEWHDAPIELRSLWAKKIIPIIQTDSRNPDDLRPWDLVLHLDGSVTNEVQSTPQDKAGQRAVYPARYRIPPTTLLGFQHAEMFKRAESFALESLLYELTSGHSGGLFPDDFPSTEMRALIYSYWSWEFAAEMERIRKPPFTISSATFDILWTTLKHSSLLY